MSAAVEVKKLIDRGLGIPAVLACRAGHRLVGRRPRPAGAEVRRVLCIKLWGVGNLAMILPLVRAVRARYPTASVEFLTLSGNAAFVAACPWIDRVHRFQPAGWLRPFVSLLGLARTLRRRRFDLVLDFEQFLRATALLTRLARPLRSVGFRTPGQLRDGLHDVEIDLDGGRHMAHGFGDLVRAAGIPLDGDLPPLHVPRSAAAAARVDTLVSAWRADGRPLVVVHAGSGDNFPGRRWPADSFAALADHLVRQRDARIVFTGTAAETGLVRRCRRRMAVESVDLTGLLDVLELVELLARVDLVVSNDTAPVHLAAALEVPLIAIYGPNSPDLYGPLSSSARVFYERLGCSPCITNRNAKTSYCRTPLCMRAIAPARVAAAALRMLDGRPVRAAPAAAATVPR